MDAYIIGLLSILYSTCLCAADGSGSGRVHVVSYARQSSNKQYPTVSLILERITSSRLSCGVACSENIECQAFHFTTNTRSCELYKESPPSGSVSTDREQILFYVRNTRNGPLSNTLPFASPPERQEEQELQVRRFFVATDGNHKLSQLYLHGGTLQMTTYNYISYRGLFDIHYNFDMQMIFMSTYEPDEIVCFPLDSDKKSRVIRGRYSRLSVDEKNGLIFAICTNKLYSMTTKGNDLRVVIHLGAHVYINGVAAADQKAFVFYSNVESNPHLNSILSITYSGSVLEHIVTGTHEHIFSLDYNPITHSLVYNQRTEIMTYNTVSKKYHFLFSANTWMTNIHVDHHSVYILDTNTLILYNYKMNHKKSVELPVSERGYTHIVPVY